LAQGLVGSKQLSATWSTSWRCASAAPSKMACRMGFSDGAAFNFDAFEDFVVVDGDGWQTPGAAVNTCGPSHDQFRLKGDFYREPDNLYHSGCFSDVSNDEAFAAAWTGHVASMKTTCSNDWLLPHAVLYSKRFEATKVPPMAPSDVFFRFQPTTCWLRGVAAPDIGNKLLDFLVSTVALTITKVNHAKFTIKANVYMDGCECAVKLRMYSDNAHRALALEFQRRSGCGLVFKKFYQLARSYLEACQESMQLEPLGASKWS